MLILGGLGLMHSRRVSPAADILSGHPARATDPGTAPSRATRPSDQPAEEDLAAAAPGSSNGRFA